MTRWSGTIAGRWAMQREEPRGAGAVLRLYADFLSSALACRARGAYAFAGGAEQDAAAAHKWLKERGYLQ